MNTTIRRFFQITVIFLLFVQGIQPSGGSQTKSFLPITADQTSASPLLASPPELANLPGQEGLPLDFIPNRGQWDPAVKFVARKDGLSAVFERNSIQLQLGMAETATLGLTFEGASRAATLLGEEQQSTTYNFFMGNDPGRWQSNVPAYGSLLYGGLYDGVDIRVREAGDQLEYDLLLAPASDLAQVVIRAEGALGLEVASDGSLILQTASGPLRQTPPLAWELLATGEQRPITTRFRLIDGQRYGFDAPGHDAQLALVIDPGLEWATFLGGGGHDTVMGMEMASDGTGDLVLVGQTWSADFPHTSGNFAPVGGTPYVARLNAAGTALVYTTFFGGSFNHSVMGMALDSLDRPVVVGDTNSLDFPTTPGAYDRTPGNGFQGDYDAYVIQFDAIGGGPVFGTYLAGSPGAGWEQAWHAGFDPSGSVIVSGFSSSPDFPITAGAYPGQPNLFISRLDPTGSQLTYSAFLGPGSVFDMVVDGNGFVTLTGQVTSTSFPTTAGAFDRTLGNTNDGFVARLKLDGGGAADLKYSTFLGGSQYTEAGTGIAVDPNNPALVTVAGWTRSGDFPTTAGALLRTHFAPVDTTMAFVARFNFPEASGGSLLWSTFYGALGNQTADDVAVDATGAVILVGGTAGNNPPTTERSYDRTPASEDVYAARISADGSQLLYSTLYGGLHVDYATHVVSTGGTSVVIAGQTKSIDLPITSGAFDPVFGTDGHQSEINIYDVFLARLSLEPNATGDTTPPPAPALVVPANAATYVAPLELAFDWTDADDASGIEAYHIQVSPNSAFFQDPGSIAGTFQEAWLTTSWTVISRSVSNVGTLYWRVQALDNAHNLGPWSEVRTLTVQSPTPPPAPTLLSPPNGGRFGPGNVTFAWNPAPTAQFYTIQVDDSSNFSSPVLIWVNGIAATQYTTAISTERTYWWRVQANNQSFTASPWSAVRSFEIRAGSPPAPPPPTPTAGPSTPTPQPATAVSSLTLNSTSVIGGGTSQGTVTLNGAAPAGGAVVSLASQYPNLATVPPSVTVPAGSTSATFTVSAQTGIELAYSVPIAAEYGGVTQGALLTVFADTPITTIYTFTLNVTTVTGGNSAQGTIALIPGWTAPPGGAIVTLASSNPAVAAVPPSVTIPAGANSAIFNITTQSVGAATPVTIFATRNATKTALLTVAPPAGAPTATSTLAPSSTPTTGPTATRTRTPTPTRTPTRTLTPTRTRTPTAGPSSTPTTGPTFTPTLGSTPTLTAVVTTVTAFPNSTTILVGTLRGGMAANLNADDNAYYEVNSTTSGTRTSEWYGSFTGVSNAFSNLKITYKGKNSNSATQTIAIWNWTTNSWVQLDSRSVGTNEVLIADLIPTGTLADFVSGTTGDGELRVRIRATRNFGSFFASGDLLTIVYDRP